MKKGRDVRIAALLLAGLLVVGSVPRPAFSRAIDDAMPVPSEEISLVEERAIGVFGAMLCGAEGWLIRTNPIIGMNPYVLAAGMGGCLLALLDVATS